MSLDITLDRLFASGLWRVGFCPVGVFDPHDVDERAIDDIVRDAATLDLFEQELVPQVIEGIVSPAGGGSRRRSRTGTGRLGCGLTGQRLQEPSYDLA